MLLVQKLLNHPVFTLPAWQLEGCQTLLQFFICTQFRWFGAQAVVCVCVCIVSLVSSVSLIALLFTPFLSNSPYFPYFSSTICLSSAIFFFSASLPSVVSLQIPPYLFFFCLLKLSTSSCLFITLPPSLCLSCHLLLLPLLARGFI